MSQFKVLSLGWEHETNTFCVVETNLDSFKRQCYLTDPKELYDHSMKSPSALSATYEAAGRFGWDLHVPLHAVANPSGRLTDDVFESISSQILSSWDSSFDGALLHLHGAMVSCSYEDCEGELLRRMREKHAMKNGKKVPIVVTLDLHGNITKQMADHATALIAVRTYPHIDYYERAVQGIHLSIHRNIILFMSFYHYQIGADILQRSMLGLIEPVTLFAEKKPMLRGLHFTW